MTRKMVDYLFVIQRERKSLARVLPIDAEHELEAVRQVCERLMQGNAGAQIHYARRPADDTIVIMERFDEDY